MPRSSIDPALSLVLGELEKPLNSKENSLDSSQSCQVFHWFISMVNDPTAPSPSRLEIPSNTPKEDVKTWLQILSCYELQEMSGIMDLEEYAAAKNLSLSGEYVYSCRWELNGTKIVIYGMPRLSRKAALSSASLIACKYLKKNGHLCDDELTPLKMPPSQKADASLISATMPTTEGSPKLRPRAFQYFSPSHRSFFITIIHIEYKGDPLFNPQMLAIATRNPINSEAIPRFHAWPRRLEMHEVTFRSFSKEAVIFSESEHALLLKFQDQIWTSIGLEPMKGSRENDDSETRYFLGLAVMPLKSGWAIDWSSMSHVPKCTPFQLFGHLLDAAFREQPLSSLAVEINKASKTAHTLDFSKIFHDQPEKAKAECFNYLSDILSLLCVQTNYASGSIMYTNLQLDPSITGLTRFSEESSLRLWEFFERRMIGIKHPRLFGFRCQRRGGFQKVLNRPEIDLPSGDTYQKMLLEGCTIVPITEWFLTQLYCLPQILYYLEQHCTIEDFLQDFRLPPIPRNQIFAAFLAPGSDGMENYERYEYLGDAALKCVIGVYLYQNEMYNEHALSSKKSRLVSNAKLNAIGRKMNFDCLLTIGSFNPTVWHPPGFRPRSSKSPPLRQVSVKTCADFVEALAGAFMAAGGLTMAWKYFQAIGVVPSQDSVWQRISSHHKYRTPQQIGDLNAVQKTLNYKFNNVELLAQALFYPCKSLSGESNFQRLEFLGDSVMDGFLAHHNFSKYPEATPEIMTYCRHAIVGRESFCRMSYSLGLHEQLKCPPAFDQLIEPYISYLDSLPPFSDPMATDFEGPKILCDVFEAVIGAVFVDNQGDWTRTLNSIWPIWSRYLALMTPDELAVQDVKRLIEWLAKNKSVGIDLKFKFENV